MHEHTQRLTVDPERGADAVSEAIAEAVRDHDAARLDDDELPLYDHVDPDALDELFAGTGRLDVRVRIALDNVTVSVWTEEAVNVRVTSMEY